MSTSRDYKKKEKRKRKIVIIAMPVMQRAMYLYGKRKGHTN